MLFACMSPRPILLKGGEFLEYWREKEDFPFQIRLSLDVPVIHCCYAVSGVGVRRGENYLAPILLFIQSRALCGEASSENI